MSLYNAVLSKALKMPGAKVDRSSYLRSNLRKHCSSDQIDLALSSSIKDASISLEVLDKLAKSAIRSQLLKVTGISTLTGLPGGIAMYGTIPIDFTQYYYHIIVLSQKLAYIYGYPDLNGDADDELVNHLTIFMGIMFGVTTANQMVINVSKKVAEKTIKNLPNQALTHTIYYPIIKKTAKNLGYKMTKDSFAKGVGKFIPVLGGLVSGGLTLVSFYPMSVKLKRNLEEAFEYSKVSDPIKGTVHHNRIIED